MTRQAPRKVVITTGVWVAVHAVIHLSRPLATHERRKVVDAQLFGRFGEVQLVTTAFDLLPLRKMRQRVRQVGKIGPYTRQSLQVDGEQPRILEIVRDRLGRPDTLSDPTNSPPQRHVQS